MLAKIGFGGGCHWCTEAIFQSLIGVQKVEQGWIASSGNNDTFSEAVIVHFGAAKIDVEALTTIHLYTHSCTSQHPMRKKYRSAVYIFSDAQSVQVEKIINNLRHAFDQPIITQVLPFVAFKENKEQYQNYFLKNPDNQFCQTYIHPKLKFLQERFGGRVENDHSKLLKYWTK